MAARTGAIVFSTELDLAPLQRDWAKAEQIGRTGATRAQNAIASATKSGVMSQTRKVDWGALAAERAQVAEFARTTTASGRRIRTARDFAPAPAGKYPMDLEEAESTKSQRRMIRGLGAGLTAVSAAHQLVAAYTEANEAAAELVMKTQALTSLTGTGAFRGIGEMEANLKSSSDLIDEIRQRTIRERAPQGDWLQRTLGASFRFVRQRATGDSDAGEEEKISRLRAQASKDISAIADKQQALNEAEQEALSGSERQSEILKAQIAHREKLGALAAAESAAGVNNPAARNAENARFQNELQAVGKKFDLKMREEEVENRILNLHASSLTKDQQSLAALRERIALLKQQLQGEGSTEKKTEIGTQIHRLENEELQQKYQTRFDGPALYTPEKGEQAKYRAWVRSQRPSTPNAYLKHPDAYERVRDAYGGPDDPVPQSGQRYRSKLGELSKHMPEPGHMTPYAGSEDMDWFRDNPRKFGPAANILRNSDKEFYNTDPNVYGSIAKGAVGGAASMSNAPLSPADKHEGAKDMTGLIPLLGQILEVIRGAAAGVGANK